MKYAKSVLLGLALYVSTLIGCIASAPPSLGDPPAEASPVLSATVLPYIGDAGRCSAVAIEGHILSTARHCVVGLGAGYVIMPGGILNPVESAWASRSDDVALLQVRDELPLATAVSQRIPRLADGAYVAGYGCDSTAEHMRLGVRFMRYSGRDSFGMYWYAGGACHGDSGGGVFDEEGALIGITVQVNTDEGPVSAVGVEPLAGVLDGLASDDGWAPADDFLE